MNESARETLFDRIRQAIDEGRFDDALRELQELDPDDASRWLSEAEVWEELGDFKAAEAAYAHVRSILGDGHPVFVLHWGYFALLRWRVDEARESFARLRPSDLDADSWAMVLDRQALIAEIEGEFERADALYAEAHAHCSAHPAPPARLSADEFRQVVQAAATDLPVEFRSAFEHVAVVIDPMPSAELLGAPESGFGPDVLGLHSGLPLTDFLSTQGGGMPPRIHLFQRNLERAVSSPDELSEQIRITLYHELGHALGFDEEEVDEMGLG